MFKWIADIVLGCGHTRTTFPQTTSRGTYICCLCCGAEIEFNWKDLRVGRVLPPVITHKEA